MKKILYTLLAVSLIFTACKKEEEEIVMPVVAPSIVGVWTPNSVSVNANQTVTIVGQIIQSFDTSYTMTAQEAGIEGEIEFTSDGSLITTNDDGDLETDSYIDSGSSLTITSSDDGSTENATYIVTNTNLTFTISDTETETDMGTTYTSTYDMTVYCTRQ